MYIFVKNILEGRGETQNNFVYGELGSTSLKSRQAVNVIRYWFNTKYVKNIFCLMYRINTETVCIQSQWLCLYYIFNFTC